MKELKYLDAATVELIKNKVTDSWELVKNEPTAANPYQYGIRPCTQAVVYVQLPCLYDVLVGYEIKAVVEETLTEINEKDTLKGVLALTVIKAREIYELDKDGNEYMSGNDDNTAFIGMAYYHTPSIGYVVKAIEDACKIQMGTNTIGNSTGVTFQYVEGKNKGHLISIIESAIKALADGEDYKGFKFKLTSCDGFNRSSSNVGPVVYGTACIGNLNLKITNPRKQEKPFEETIFEYTIGEDDNE